MRPVIIILLLSTTSGFSSFDPSDPPAPVRQSKAPDLKASDLIADGERVFAKSCSIPYCHGKDGAAGRAPAVRDKPWEVSALRKIILEGIPNTSMPNWNDKLAEREVWGVVAYILSIAGEAPAGPAPTAPGSEKAPGIAATGKQSPLPESALGDPRRGEQLFFESARGRGCSGCHAIDGKGNQVGPDLSGSARRSPRDIFRDLVYPGASIPPAQRVLRITMTDGEIVLGLRQEETTTAIRMFDLGSVPPVLRRLAKDQIKSEEQLEGSAMPSRYGEIYTFRELLDLVSFIKSSGSPSPVKVSFLDLQ